MLGGVRHEITRLVDQSRIHAMWLGRDAQAVTGLRLGGSLHTEPGIVVGQEWSARGHLATDSRSITHLVGCRSHGVQLGRIRIALAPVRIEQMLANLNVPGLRELLGSR